VQIGAKHRVSSGVQLEAFAAAVRANFPSKSLAGRFETHAQIEEIERDDDSKKVIAL
jgi:hypothetical protein